jgi:hypothetical protein
VPRGASNTQGDGQVGVVSVQMDIIIFGTKDKKSNTFPRINYVGGGALPIYFSRTNFNLFLTEDETKYVSFGTLLEKANTSFNLLRVGQGIFSNSMNELIFSPEICYQCANQTLGCPLIVKDVEIKDIGGIPIKWWYLRDEYEILDWKNQCPFFQAFLELTETKAEKRFLELYLNQHLQYFIQDIFEKIVVEGKNFVMGSKDIIPDILNSEPCKRIPGHKGWGRDNGGAPLTVALIDIEEYDRSSLLRSTSDLPLWFKKDADRLQHLAVKGVKVHIGTASNLNEMEVYELGEWLRRSLYQIDALIPQVWLRHQQFSL